MAAQVLSADDFRGISICPVICKLFEVAACFVLQLRQDNTQDKTICTSLVQIALLSTIGKVWIYRLLFVFVCVFVCTVTNFSAKDKTSGVKFCTAVHRRPRQRIFHFCKLCFLRSPESDVSAKRSGHGNRDVNITVKMP